MTRLPTITTTAFLAAALLGASACSTLPDDAVTADDGPTTSSVRLALSTTTTVPIASATYLMTGPNGYDRMGTISAGTGGELSALVGGIPPGTGYQVTIDGTSRDASVTCSGSATFDVSAHTTTGVSVPLLCREVTGTGSVAITDTTNVCPVVDGVSADPPGAASGATVALTGVAHDKDNGPSPLAYQWSASAGTFDDASAQNPTFTCPTTMTSTMVTVTLTVTDGGPGCSDTMSLTVTCG
jgi:hypothetical protein